ncbi:hypothetical protein [Micromonospora sp. LOL_021]|uniref:hypothetical protein n=1 Tax=Micromonospora sp. LOL_021 TaxID=3345417 RepID=UPI003A854AEB
MPRRNTRRGTRPRRSHDPDGTPASTRAAPAAPGRPRSTLARRLVPYGFLSPTVLLIVVLMVVPIVMVVGYSFRDNVIVQEISVLAGFANYTKVLTYPDFLAGPQPRAR